MNQKADYRWIALIALLLCVVGLSLLGPSVANAFKPQGSNAYSSQDQGTVSTVTTNTYLGNNPDSWRSTTTTYHRSIGIQSDLADGVTGQDNQPATRYTPHMAVSPAITPRLIYSTYLGGNHRDEGWSVAVDQEGNTYISGITESPDFPRNPADRATNDKDIFVAKLDNAANLVYVTVLGGSSGEEGNAIAVDELGNAYVGGETFSRDFPVLNAWQPTFAGYEDAFLLKLDPDGRLVFSTYIGGSRGEEINDMAIDAEGRVYLGGEVYSDDYPLMNPWSSATYGEDEEDAFITIFSPDGEMLYSTLISAPQRDQVFAIAVDAAGCVYGTGMTSSPDFPTVNAFQTTYGGDWDDAFVFKLDPWRNEMIYSTFLGGHGRDEGWGIAVDDEGAVYVTGFTSSSNFPLAEPIQSSFGGWDDVFITKLSPSGQLLFSTYLGGAGRDRAWGVALDSEANVYVAGETESPTFPTVNALQGSARGGIDGFLVVLSPDHTLRYASFVGGYEYDRVYDIAVDDDWIVHIVGGTKSGNFPTTTGTTRSGREDAFIARFSILPTPTPTPPPTPTPTPTPIPPVQEIVGPAGTTLQLAYPGHVTLLTVPTGYVTDSATFTLTYENIPNLQGDLTGFDHFFGLDTDLSSTIPLSDNIKQLPNALALILEYDTPPIIQETLTLYQLKAGTWITDGIQILSRYPNRLEAEIGFTGIFGLLGESHRTWLPVILRDSM